MTNTITAGTAIVNEYRYNQHMISEAIESAHQPYIDRNEKLRQAWNLLYPQFEFPVK